LHYHYRTIEAPPTEKQSHSKEIPYLLKGISGRKVCRNTGFLAWHRQTMVQFVKIRTKFYITVSELSQNTQLHTGVEPNRLASFEREPGVTSIRVENHMALVSVRFPDAIPQSRLRLLDVLAQARVPINQVKLLPEGLCFVISENHASACKKLLNDEKGEVSVFGDMALISTLAGAMRDLSGVIARICEALLSASIPNRQVGDAYDAVLCLVPSADAERAVAALREQFGLATEAVV
jgi:aspartate kinase